MKNNLILFFILFICVLIHWAWITLHRFQLPQSEIQKPTLIEGVIDSIPEKKIRGVRFTFHTQRINHQNMSTRFLISWYRYPPTLHSGEHWQLTVKLKPVIGSHNPGGFDYEQFLLSRGIAATGSVDVRDGSNKLIGRDQSYTLQDIREKIQSTVSQAISDRTLSAFISALCVGLRDGLTENDWQVLQKTGTNHLVAIAGLHIGFVAALFYFFTNKIARLFPRLLLFIPATRLAEISALISALGYSALSGFAVPAQRASIMLFFLMIGTIFCRPMSLTRRLFFAAAIILILNPFDLLDASFCLSFVSIGFLAWVMTGRLTAEKHLKSWMKMQGAIVIGLLPLMLLFFQQASLIAIFTNAIAIPWIGFVILPVVIVAVLFNLLSLQALSLKIFCLSGKLLYPLWQFLSFSSQVSIASWHHAISSPWVLICSLIGAFFLLAPTQFPMRFIGSLGVLPLFFYQAPHPKAGDFWMSVIDVGQGLSVLVQTAHHVMLYDTGAHFPGGFDFGESVVAPYLRYRDIHAIDRLEISHGDNDHSGGADAIVKDFKVRSFFTSAPQLITHFNASYCYAGQDWRWDNVVFKTLNPIKNQPYADNNSSCVIQIANQKTELLLTGDIQKETEYALVDRYGSQLRSAVLIAPHHGSSTSSSELFLKAVSPRYAIVSAGKLNRYHLPSKKVIQRYQAHSIKIFNTAIEGAVIFHFHKDGTIVKNQ